MSPFAQNDAEYGIEFERWVLHQLLAAPPRLVAHRLAALAAQEKQKRGKKTRRKEAEEAIETTMIALARIFNLKYFTDKGDLLNTTGQQYLYAPQWEGLRYWDFILHLPQHEPPRLVFIQVSKSSLRQHNHVAPGAFRIRNSIMAATSGGAGEFLAHIDP